MEKLDISGIRSQSGPLPKNTDYWSIAIQNLLLAVGRAAGTTESDSNSLGTVRYQVSPVNMFGVDICQGLRQKVFPVPGIIVPVGRNNKFYLAACRKIV